MIRWLDDALHTLRGILEDGKGDWRFWYVLLCFLLGVLAWWQSLTEAHTFMLFWSCLDFLWVAIYGNQFWQRTKNNRSVRAWKRRDMGKKERE